MIVGVDTGGTFTDVVVWDGNRLTTAKVPTTDDQSEGVVDGTGSLLDTRADDLIHGTTVATNALLERAGAETALVTTAGFSDVIEIGRQDRPALYDPFADRPQPLVGRDRRLELSPDGELGLDALAGAEAVAVSLLYSYEDGAAERSLAERIGDRFPGVPVSLSSEVAAEFREYERTSTTVLNAYLTPPVAGYLERLVERVRSSGLAARLAVMRSSGGLIDPEDAARLPAAVLLSGPAGGVVATAAVGEALGYERVISFDMGGTSTDVCRIEHGRPEVMYERPIEGYPCRLPATAIHTVGAGGGSIGWIDPGGSLRVGPRSAGASPGPACYGRGGRLPTVTDANVVLGRMSSTAELGGVLPIDAGLAVGALGRLGGRLGLDAVGAAHGMVRVIEEVMAGAVRRVSIEEGVDPRGAVLVAFGGAGGLHATTLARSLDMDAVVVPPVAGVFSALGMLLSPPRIDSARSVLLDSDREAGLDHAVSAVAAEVTALQPSAAAVVSTVVDVRYRGQSHELTVPYSPGEGWSILEARFHEAHERRNGFRRGNDPIEAVTVRAWSTAPPALAFADLPEWVGRGEARLPRRPVMTGAGPVDAGGWWRDGLDVGAEITGPAVIEEREATTYLAPGERARVHPSGALEVTW